MSPFRSVRLDWADAGWWRCAAAVLIGLLAPALIAASVIYLLTPDFAGPPKDGRGFTLAEHFFFFIGLLAASVVVSWMLAPVALVLLRLAAVTGWAGWASAAVAALIVGLPSAHVILNGDITTENTFLLPHLALALIVLGLSIRTIFYVQAVSRQKRPRGPQKITSR